MRLAILAAAAAVAAAGPLVAQPRITVLDSVNHPQPVDGVTQTEDVRFRTDRYQRMTVPVWLGKAGPYRFLVDTGADRTAVSNEVATALRLEPAGTASLHSVTGAATVNLAKLPSLKMTSKEVTVASVPLLRKIDIGADGILGVDSLRSQRVQFDFRSGTMSIVPAAKRDFREEKGTIVVRARERNGRLILSQASVEGRTVALIVDTGSEITIGNDALRRRLLRSDPRLLQRISQIELHSVTGARLVGDYMLLRRLEIGGATLKNVGIVFAEAHTFRQIGLDERPAMLLGMNAMRAFDKVSIDFANKKLRLLLPEHSDAGGITYAARAAP